MPLYYPGDKDSLVLTRIVPTTINNFIEIGTFSVQHNAHALRISATASNLGFSVSKIYNIAIGFGSVAAGSWREVLAREESGVSNGNDFAIDIIAEDSPAGGAAARIKLRLRRKSGSTTGICEIKIEHLNAYAWVESSATGVGGVSGTFGDSVYYHAASGWEKLKSDLLLQWGTGTLSSSDGTNYVADVVLPATFTSFYSVTNNVFHSGTSNVDSRLITTAIANQTLSTFQIIGRNNINSSGNTTRYTYIAIGK